MKKTAIILMFFISLFAMASCTKEDNPLIKSIHLDSDFDSSGDTLFSTQYQVYGKDIGRLTCFIQNNTDEELMYGEDYGIEKLVDRTWYQIPFPENTAFNSLGHVLAPKSTDTVYIDLSFLDYEFANGSYRIIKKIGEKTYDAEFELGESNITEETPYGFQELKKIKENYSTEQAIADGAVVITYAGIKNSEKIGLFLEDVSRNITAMLRIVQYTIEGDPIITDITYYIDGDNYFTLATDNSRDKFAGNNKSVNVTIFSYLITDKSKIYLSNYAEWNGETDKDKVCLLSDYEEFQWKELVPLVEEMTEQRLLSNSAIYKVFSSDGAKNIILTEDPLEFGYNTEGFGEMRYIENKLGIAVKIVETLWVDDHTILLVCDTDSDMKYYEFFDVESRSVVSYKASAFDYLQRDGKIVIPE